MINQTQKPQLFLLHFAGGSRYSFNFLKDYLQNSIDFLPLELPGRGQRIGESLLISKEEAILDYVDQIIHLRNHQPFNQT